MKIMLSGLFADKPVFRKFLILVSIVLFSTLVFSMVGALIVKYYYGVDLISNEHALDNMTDSNVIAAMKVLQIWTTGIGMFLLPSLILAWLFSTDPKSYLSLNRGTSAPVILFTILIMFAAVPAINMLLVFNQRLELPGFLSGLENWMKESEDQAGKITEVFLTMKTTSDLMYNLFIIALLPALGEEFLFRGIIQKLFREHTSNIHVAILLSAILFSAFHMQFYGFFPRMMLGVLFGYMLVWTGSIWVPVTAHLVNNGAAVIFAYYAGKNELPFDQDTIGTSREDWPMILGSIVLCFVLGFLIKKFANPKEEQLL